MKRRKPPSFLALSVAVLLPLVLLVVLAWLGTRSQLQVAWAAARNEADLNAENTSSHLGKLLTEKAGTVPAFQDPPVPSSRELPNDPLDGDNIAALLPVRDDPGAGLSSSGLPRRLLAGMRILEMTRETADAEAVLRIAVDETPSVLTPKALARVNEIFPGMADPASAKWDRALTVRKLIREDPFLEENKGWQGSWWLAGSAKGTLFLHEDDVKELSRTLDKGVPEWAAARVSSGGRFFAGPELAHQGIFSPFMTYGWGGSSEIMAGRPIIGPGDLRFEIVAIKPSSYQRLTRLQARWTLALIGIAMAGAIGGLWVIRRVYERERKLNALKSDFVASVSHELRAPIASIRLMADALEEGKIEQGTAHEFHRLISREGARLSTLIENVLDFARIEQGKKQWKLEETDLRALLMDTVALMEPLAGEKDIDLQVEVPETSTATLDPDAIRQALVNLLDNAIKFSPAGSAVKMVLSETPDATHIAIIDDGPGIPPKEHGRIFEKFHRLGGELRRETQGTGIGLSLVKAIAEAHGGRIDLESEPGKGSTFTLILPKKS